MNKIFEAILTLQNIAIYFAIINLIGFMAMGIDKLFARLKMWRISEKTLIILTCIGGGIGTTTGMFLFRHKITKKGFKPAFIIITVLEIMVVVYFVIKYIV